MTTLPPPPQNSEPPHPQQQVALTDPRSRIINSLYFISDAAVAPAVGSKRPTGNDLFREKLMAASAASHSSSSSSTALPAPAQTKRQALGADDGVGETSDWQELTTHQNHTYFLHVPTGRGQWNRPALLAGMQEAVGVHVGGDERAVASAAGEGQGGSSAAADDPATYADAPSCRNQKM
jgi:hypothetical protein